MVSAVTLRRPLPTLSAPRSVALVTLAPRAARPPRERAHRRAVPILPEHDVEGVADRTAAGRAEALAAQQLDALHGGERQGVEVASRRGVGRAVHQHGQRLPAGQQIADDPGIQKLLKVLGAGPLEKVALQRDDDPRRGREGAGVGGGGGQGGQGNQGNEGELAP